MRLACAASHIRTLAEGRAGDDCGRSAQLPSCETLRQSLSLGRRCTEDAETAENALTAVACTEHRRIIHTVCHGNLTFAVRCERNRLPLCKHCVNTSPWCANTCCVNSPNQCANTYLNPLFGVPTLALKPCARAQHVHSSGSFAEERGFAIVYLDSLCLSICDWVLALTHLYTCLTHVLLKQAQHARESYEAVGPCEVSSCRQPGDDVASKYMWRVRTRFVTTVGLIICLVRSGEYLISLKLVTEVSC